MKSFESRLDDKFVFSDLCCGKSPKAVLINNSILKSIAETKTQTMIAKQTIVHFLTL